MGIFGWTSWLKDEVEKLKLISSMLKDGEEKAILDKTIAEMEAKIK